MKSFTKFFVLMLAMLVSFGMMAQEMSDLEFQVLQQKAQQELVEHGPSLDVPYEPNNVTATGDDCTDPLVITVSSGMNQVQFLGETTCGRVDDYDAAYGTCINPTYYSNGEDMVFELVVQDDMWLEFIFDPVETYSSFWVMSDCPSVGSGNTCIIGKSEYANTPKTVSGEFTAGTYYIQVDSWPSPDCITFDLTIDEMPPPPQADPIVIFPYTETFETCVWPATMLPFAGAEAHAVVSNAAGFESSCGAMLDGNSYLGFYHEYNNNCDNAFNFNFPDHTAQISMNYTPDATAGVLQLDFDFNMQFSFQDYYSWFRVKVKDGAGWHVLQEKNSGDFCIQGDIDWTQLIYELSAYQNTGENYELVIDFVGKYYVDYYNGGDVVKVDNVHLWFVPAGNVEGHAYDGDMTSPLDGVEIGFLGDEPPYPPVLTDVNGYYKFSNVATEPIDHYDLYGFLDGMNYVEQSAIFVTGVTITLNWNMASPLMVITPAVLEETMNPNEWRSVPITITNGPTGGPLHWTAEIEFGPPPSAASSHSVPPFTGEILPALAPETNGLAPEGFGTPGNEASGTRGIMAFGYEAVGGGTYNFDVDDVAGATQVGGAAPGGDFFGGMIFDMEDDNIAYGITFYGSQLYSIDRTTGVYTLVGSCPGLVQTAGMAVDLTEGIYYVTSSDQLWTVDITSGATTNVGPHGTSLMIGMAGDGEGNLWGYDMSADQFHSIDKATGAATAVGSVGFNAGFAQSMFYDQLDDRVIMAAFNVSNYYAEIRHVDVTTGASTILSSVYFIEYTGSAAPASSAGGGWLDLSAFEGDVLSGESNFVSALFDATGTVAGQVWTADVHFTAQPNISTATVDVSMIIAGEPLVPVDEFEAVLVNMVTGQVDMSWSFASNDITFEYFLIRRDGAPIANTQNYSYVDILPEYGEFCYTVSAVYTEGESVPAGPECVIWLIPELCYTPDPVYGEVWTGATETFPLLLENCGEGMLSFEFEGFDDPDFNTSFVVGVSPYSGVIPEGEAMTVNVTFSAVGFGAGLYGVNLSLLTNELSPDNERDIACEMLAYTPATLYGTVVDCNSNMPIPNVTVAAGNGTDEFFSETDATGYYEMYVDEDTYSVLFVKLGYLNYKVEGVFAPAGQMTEVSGVLCETPYPVQWVKLDPNEADTQAMITWSLPMGPYEIIYDDGSAEEYFAWIQWGGATAVKFTPAGYPAKVAAGRIYVGDGSFPDGANFIGSPMSVGVADDDGTNGMPGTILDSVSITCNNYGWVTFGLNGATINEGNFYLVYWQTSIPPYSPPVGVDEENPIVFRSYTRQAGMDWQMSVYNDFMIRATVFGPGDNVVAAMAEGEYVIPKKDVNGGFIATGTPSGIPGFVKGAQQFLPVVDESADRDLDKYRVAFVDGFNPDAGETPLDGTTHVRGTTTNNFYNDNAWGAEPPGFYAYAVKAIYESNESVWAYSNVAAHKLDYEVTVNVTQCDGEEPSGALVLMAGQNYPYMALGATTPASGTVVFDSVIRGMYDLSVAKLGYQTYEHPDLGINSNHTENVILMEDAYAPRNLYVDPLTSVATWDEPLYIAVPFAGFEEEPFPPQGWQMMTTGIGWERTDDGSSGSWTIPSPPASSGDYYAVSNDDQSYFNQQDDYLITPKGDLRAADDYVMNALWYYDGAYGHPAPEMLYSTDAGATWETLYVVNAGFDWQQIDTDLADLSGPDGLSKVWFAAWQTDNGMWGSGCAVDNIYVGNGPVDVGGYYVYLDNGFVAETDADTRTYTYGDLQYGTTYTAAVAALYACNLSPKIFYTFTSSYLYPPRNLEDAYVYNTNEVPLSWNPPVTGDGVPMNMTQEVDYVQGIYENSIGRAPLNGVAVSDGETPNEEFLSGYRVPEVFGVSNDIPAYAWFDGEAPGTVNQISSWPGGGNFANAAEIDFDDAEYMYEVDNTGATRRVNLIDGTVETLGSIGVLANAMALDYTTGIYYATDGNSLFTMDFDAMTSTNVGGLGSGAGNLMIGMTFNPDGELYMYDIVVDNMWSCDKETGACTQIGNIGYDANFGQGMAWDDLNEVAVLSSFNSGAFACEYRVADLTTGSTTLVGNIGSPGVTQFGTICIPVSGGPPGGGGDIPDGLLSYNIYQDLMLVGNKVAEAEEPDEWETWIHNPVDPGCYDYTVTAVYDLGVYGFPGQTGESFHEGPDTVCVVWGFDLPFMEMWDEGDFGFNNWRVDPQQNNWVIASQDGNPAPSAQFNWDPDPGESYAVSLTSAPLNADLLTEGDIWMDFEFFLNNRYETGEEKLVVEVFDGATWTQVAEFANTMSFDWTPQHLKITQYAMTRVFQVRFTAMGMNSFDVINWNVDNIYIYRECEAPSDLDGEYYWAMVDDYGAEIWWEAPDIPVPPQGWIRWDDGVNFSGIGLTDGGDWSVAIRWDAGMLAEYAGTDITKVQFFPQDDGFDYIKVKIWTGANAGTLVYESDNLTPSAGTWYEYTVDPPVPLDPNQELWVGYSIFGQPPGMFPAGTDAGPAVAGYGDKISTDGTVWDNLSDFGLDYNWNLAAWVETISGSIESITPLVDDMVYDNVTTDLSRGAMKETGIPYEDVNGTRDFTGFNIYRMGPDDDEYELIDFVAYIENETDYNYIDEDPFGGEVYPYTVCYQVTSVWEGDADYCESAPAASVIPIYDYVCILVTGIDNPLAGQVTALYPNPAVDRVNITSSQEMTHLTIVNYVGQVVYNSDLNNANQLTLNTSSYDAGVYVVRITTESGITTKRMTISQ